MALSLSKSLSELPEYRYVLANLIARDLKVKYQDKALGFLWSLLHPAIMLGIWYLIFSRVARLDVGLPRYWAFLLPAMLTYQFIAGAISEGAQAVRSNSGIIRKVYVPMEILVLAAVTVKMIEFILQLTVACVVLALLHKAGTTIDSPYLPIRETAEFSAFKTLVVLPGALVLIYLFVLGVTMPLSGYTILYRDLDHLISLTLMALFYLSPIFWRLEMIEHHEWMPLFALNPVTEMIQLVRGPLYWGTWPDNIAVGGGAMGAWLSAIAVSLTTFTCGWLLLGRVKHTLAEVV